MTAEQRWLFDATGFLHIEAALSPPELSAAQAAAEGLLQCSADQLPPHVTRTPTAVANAFSAHPALQALTSHSATWGLIQELTAQKPRLTGGNLRTNRHDDPLHAILPLHSARESWGGEESTAWNAWWNTEDGIRSDYFIVFWYLTDVHPGDGGLVVVPGRSVRLGCANVCSLVVRTVVLCCCCCVNVCLAPGACCAFWQSSLRLPSPAGFPHPNRRWHGGGGLTSAPVSAEYLPESWRCGDHNREWMPANK